MEKVPFLSSWPLWCICHLFLTPKKKAKNPFLFEASDFLLLVRSRNDVPYWWPLSPTTTESTWIGNLLLSWLALSGPETTILSLVSFTTRECLRRVLHFAVAYSKLYNPELRFSSFEVYAWTPERSITRQYQVVATRLCRSIPNCFYNHCKELEFNLCSDCEVADTIVRILTLGHSYGLSSACV